MTLTLHEPGLSSGIVDAGRPGSRGRGVPSGGAADRLAWQLGNALVGNRPDAAALEFALAGPTVSATVEIACAVSGAPFALRLGERTIPAGATFTLRPGERLRIGGTPAGARGYLCVGGGFDAPVVLGSRSSWEPLRPGATFGVRPGRIGGRALADGPRSWTHGTAVLRVLPGAQADWFDRAAFAAAEYRASADGNRMGVRLDGEPLRRPDREIVSEPVCPGTVQVVNDGRCIVLGVDGQTIGGYPKIAQVITADWDRIGQLRPGQAVRFRWVTLDEADRARAERDRLLQSWLARLSVG